MIARRLLVPVAAAAVIALAGCGTASDVDAPPPSVVALQDELAAIEGVGEAEVFAPPGMVAITLEIAPEATDPEQITDAVVAAVARSRFSRAALEVTFDDGSGRTFTWEGYDPAFRDRYATALGLWWRELGAEGSSGSVAREWLSYELDVSADSLVAGESVVARLAAVRADAAAAGLTILEDQFSANYPFGAYEAEPDAFMFTPSSTADLLDDVVRPPGIQTYLAAIGMNLAQDDDDPSRHIIPTEIYIIPTELPGGGFPPLDSALAQVALDALRGPSFQAAVASGVRIDGVYLLTDTGLVRVNGE
jgi:hypothetical protein